MGNAQMHEAVNARADPWFITILRYCSGPSEGRLLPAHIHDYSRQLGPHRSKELPTRSAHEPPGSAGAVVPALVFPAVDLACAVAGTLVLGAVDFWPVGHFSFGQVLGHLLGHALPLSQPLPRQPQHPLQPDGRRVSVVRR
jgi:hypothetical protein